MPTEADRGRERVGATRRMDVSRDVPGRAPYRVALSIAAPSRGYHRADMVPIRREEETSVVSHRTGRVESLR